MVDRVMIEVPEKFEFSSTPEMCEQEQASILMLNGEIGEEEYTRRLLVTKPR